jgi:hypothetical protein
MVQLMTKGTLLRAVSAMAAAAAATAQQTYDNTICSPANYTAAQTACTADSTCSALPWKDAAATWSSAGPNAFPSIYPGRPNHGYPSSAYDDSGAPAPWPATDEQQICDNNLGRVVMHCYFDSKSVKPAKCACAQKKAECVGDASCSGALTRQSDCCANPMCKSASQQCPRDFVGGGDCPSPGSGGGGGAHGGSKCSDACGQPDIEAMHHIMENMDKFNECNQKYPDGARRRLLSVAAHELPSLSTRTSSRRRLGDSCPDSLNKALECIWDHCKDQKDASDKMSCLADALDCDDPSSHTILYVFLVFLFLALLGGGVAALYIKKLGPFAPKQSTAESMYETTEG